MSGLRIKKDVDLNELMKFGFNTFGTIASDSGKGIGETTYICSKVVSGDVINLMFIESKNRDLSHYKRCERFPMYSYLYDVLIFDLIQAGLVEKVDE